MADRDTTAGRRLLVQLARWPVLGQVKTRLAKSLGDEGALAAHKALTQHTLNLLLSIPDSQCWLFWDCVAPSEAMREWPLREPAPKGLKLGQQQGEDLGERMLRAMSEVAAESNDRVLLVGSDCPVLDVAVFEAAFEALTQAESVIVPAEDGGYVLLGFRADCLAPDRLKGIAWGQGTVLQESLATLKKQGLSTRLLPPLWDVDEGQDWERWQALKKPLAAQAAARR